MNQPQQPGPQHMPAMRRSYLFVPGNRPERIAKALAAGPDAVIVDLEDAVPPDEKCAARAAALAALAALPAAGPPVLLRINTVRSRLGLADLLAAVALMERAPHALAGLMLPKAMPEDIALTGDVMDEAGIAGEIGALIETAAGLEEAARAARASPRLSFLMFGGADLALDLGVQLQWDPLVNARARLVQACGAARKPAVDMPWVRLDDFAGESAEMARSFALGFTARAAIHPRQIPAIHAALMPTPDEIAQARRVIDAFTAASERACLLDGRLVERPLVEGCRRILARARPV
ncbi:MAG: CoA ester lyase [Rhodospirillales bacterium]|nr:CoA ester lyase [Rhodospirillales bacterium]MDE2198021.1 CoA ester lyase [Rhodospirillales bacterium]MDE2574583.1 CoA ester lyase [Rhodospirillales bacterium]